jgi:hypothetical protein
MLSPVTKLTPKALVDFKALQARHPSATLTELPSGAALVTLDFELPVGWSASKVILRFIMPNGYPVAPPDGFWVSRCRPETANPGDQDFGAAVLLAHRERSLVGEQGRPIHLAALVSGTAGKT